MDDTTITMWQPAVTDTVILPSGLEARVKPFTGESQVILSKRNQEGKDLMAELLGLVLIAIGGVSFSDLPAKGQKELLQQIHPADRSACLIQARYLSLFDTDDDLEGDCVVYQYKAKQMKKTLKIPIAGFSVRRLRVPPCDWQDYVNTFAHIEFCIGEVNYTVERLTCAHISKMAKAVRTGGDLSVLSLINVRNPKKQLPDGSWQPASLETLPLRTLKAMVGEISSKECEIDTTYHLAEIDKTIDIINETDFLLAI